MQWAMNFLVQKGFTPVITPEIVRDPFLEGAGFHPRARKNRAALDSSEIDQSSDISFDDDRCYRIEGLDSSLIGTSEIPLLGLFSNRIISNDEVIVFEIRYGEFFKYECLVTNKIGGIQSLF